MTGIRPRRLAQNPLRPPKCLWPVFRLAVRAFGGGLT
jgi:hypothetical protein